MEKHTLDKFLRNAAKVAIICVMALFVYGLSSMNKTIVRLHKEKRGIKIEIAHKPKESDRWIYLSGNSEIYTSGGLIQAEGDKCAVLHTIYWKDTPHVGILELKVDFRDAQNKITETVIQKIILGPPVEEQ